MSDAFEKTPQDATAREILKRAWIWMEFGHFEKAIAACERAADRADRPLVPETIKGAVLTASGRPEEAMRHLMGLHRRNSEAILTSLYLAEACFLAGRHRRARKTLDEIDEQRLADSRWSEFARQLSRTWEQLDDLEQLPDPVEVPLEDVSEQQHEQH